jgi:hypothetical protein
MFIFAFMTALGTLAAIVAAPAIFAIAAGVALFLVVGVLAGGVLLIFDTPQDRRDTSAHRPQPSTAPSDSASAQRISGIVSRAKKVSPPLQADGLSSFMAWLWRRFR